MKLFSTVDHQFKHFKNIESAQLIITEMLESMKCIFKDHDVCRSCGHEVHYSTDICPICNAKCPHTDLYGHLTFYDKKFYEDELEKKKRQKKILRIAGVVLVVIAIITIWVYAR